jgi:hypothetical protein
VAEPMADLIVWLLAWGTFLAAFFCFTAWMYGW